MSDQTPDTNPPADRTAEGPLGHEFKPPAGIAMTDPAYDECTHRADAIGTVCGAPDGAHDADTAWAYDPNVVSWDWKAQPDLNELARLLEPHGVALTKIDTGCDEYAVRVSAVETVTAELDVDGWTLSAHPAGFMLSHETDEDRVLTAHHLPVGAVLAFIADAGAEEPIGPDTLCPCGKVNDGAGSGYCSHECFAKYDGWNL